MKKNRKLVHVEMEVIPYKDMNYSTPADYQTYCNSKGEEGWFIQSAKTRDWRYHILLMLHEFVELALVQHRNIKIKDIEKFDLLFEKEYAKGLQKAEDEPGNDKRACYYKEHQFASKVEKLMAKELDVDLGAYDTELMRLWRPNWKPKKK